MGVLRVSGPALLRAYGLGVCLCDCECAGILAWGVGVSVSVSVCVCVCVRECVCVCLKFARVGQQPQTYVRKTCVFLNAYTSHVVIFATLVSG